MPKKVTALTVSMPHHLAAEAGRFMPRQAFEQLRFWNQLKDREQDTILSEAKQLSAALMMHGSSGLAIGEHLINIQKVLKPYEGAFAKFLRNFRFTERTAYRYIVAYNNAAERLPEPVLKAAMARGMNILGYTQDRPLGTYSGAYEVLKPLPSRYDDPADANRVLDQLEQVRKEIKADPEKKAAIEKRLKRQHEDLVEEIRTEPKFLLKHSYRTVKNALRHVSSRKRRDWLESLVGMLLTEINIGHQTTFKPEAIPEDFRQGRGRPRMVTEEEKAAASA